MAERGEMLGQSIRNYMTDHGISKSVLISSGIPEGEIEELFQSATMDPIRYYEICRALGVPLKTFLCEE